MIFSFNPTSERRELGDAASVRHVEIHNFAVLGLPMCPTRTNVYGLSRSLAAYFDRIDHHGDGRHPFGSNSGLLAFAFLATQGLSAAPETGVSEWVKVSAGYKAWKPTTPKPIFVSGDSSCSPSPEAVAGPHARRFINVYVSPEGKSAASTQSDT
jgi:hypothetical protein